AAPVLLTVSQGSQGRRGHTGGDVPTGRGRQGHAARTSLLIAHRSLLVRGQVLLEEGDGAGPGCLGGRGVAHTVVRVQEGVPGVVITCLAASSGSVTTVP